MSEARVGVSLGSAVVLGLVQAPLTWAPTTVYLMLGGRCPNDCAFCAQAASSNAGEVNLSRITWPRLPIASVVAAIRERQGKFERICIQATGSPTAYAETLALVERLRRCTDLPIDASILPSSVDAATDLIAAGVEHIGFGVDAATEAVFAQAKGGSIERYTKVLEALAVRHPGSAAVHLIAGLGESERELVEAVQHYHDLGVIAALFAFFPVAGTRMSQQPPPRLAAYRRIQAAHYFIANGLGNAREFTYDAAGCITSYGAAPVRVLTGGDAFRTTGCPGCNRPFYNERPIGPIFNYAVPLSNVEIIGALLGTGIPEVVALTGEAQRA